MTRPDWCDPLVWEAANVAMTGHYEFGNEQQAFPLRVDCAKAIMAERDRCAKYATDQAEREPYGHCKATAYLIADNIMGAK